MAAADADADAKSGPGVLGGSGDGARSEPDPPEGGVDGLGLVPAWDDWPTWPAAAAAGAKPAVAVAAAVAPPCAGPFGATVAAIDVAGGASVNADAGAVVEAEGGGATYSSRTPNPMGRWDALKTEAS